MRKQIAFDRTCPKRAIQLIKSLLVVEPEDRMTVAVACRHAWFEGINLFSSTANEKGQSNENIRTGQLSEQIEEFVKVAEEKGIPTFTGDSFLRPIDIKTNTARLHFGRYAPLEKDSLLQSTLD